MKSQWIMNRGQMHNLKNATCIVKDPSSEVKILVYYDRRDPQPLEYKDLETRDRAFEYMKNILIRDC